MHETNLRTKALDLKHELETNGTYRQNTDKIKALVTYFSIVIPYAEAAARMWAEIYAKGYDEKADYFRANNIKRYTSEYPKVGCYYCQAIGELAGPETAPAIFKEPSCSSCPGMGIAWEGDCTSRGSAYIYWTHDNGYRMAVKTLEVVKELKDLKVFFKGAEERASFKPVTFSITFDTPEQARGFYALFNGRAKVSAGPNKGLDVVEFLLKKGLSPYDIRKDLGALDRSIWGAGYRFPKDEK